MPVLSMFYGIIVSMYFEKTASTANHIFTRNMESIKPKWILTARSSPGSCL